MQNPINSQNFTEEFEKILNSIRENNPITIELSIKKIGDDEAKAIAGELKDNKTLTELILDINKIGPEGAKAIAEALKDNKTLTELNLDINTIGPQGAKALAEAIKDIKTLTKLKLSRNDIGDAGVQALAEALNVNQALTELNLDINKIGPKGAKALAEAIKDNKTLTKLDLSDNEIGNAGVQAIAEAHKVNNTLTKLDLSDNKIGDAGVQALAEALKKNATLTELDLSDINIGPEGAIALAEALKTNYTIKKLYLHSDDDDFKTEINNYLTRNIKIDKISTEIFDFYTQKNSSNPIFPNIDDTLIQDSKACLKIFNNSLSKLKIDSKNSSGEQVNETEIKKEFVDKLKSSTKGMKFLFSCKEESNSFGLTFENYFAASRVARDGGDKTKLLNVMHHQDIFTNIQRYLPPLLTQKAPSPKASNPSGTNTSDPRHR